MSSECIGLVGVGVRKVEGSRDGVEALKIGVCKLVVRNVSVPEGRGPVDDLAELCGEDGTGSSDEGNGRVSDWCRRGEG